MRRTCPTVALFPVAAYAVVALSCVMHLSNVLPSCSAGLLCDIQTV